MGIGQKYICQYVNVDLHESLMPENAARFLKNLVYSLDDNTTAASDRSGATGVFKPVPSTSLYIDNFTLPTGNNHTIGALKVEEFREVYVWVHNSLGNHQIYRLNCSDNTYNVVYQGPELAFILQPEYFIHTAGAYLEVIYVTDPNSGQKKRRSYLMYTDGYNYQRFISVEDSIATSGFSATLFPFFAGTYDKSVLINMGVPTPKDCIQITEIELTEEEKTQNNRLLFNTWQFRLRYTDVWGRPSEYGEISDIYIPGGSDCLSSSSGLPRCLNLSFDVPLPYIDKVEIAYRNCNDQQWYSAEVLNLYVGSQLGDWWKRPRNSEVNYNSNTKKIIYKFCAEANCTPISPDLTNRLDNPLPRSSQAINPQGKFINLNNNKDGFLPFSKELKDKIKFTVEAPIVTPNAPKQFSNIDVYVEIHRTSYIFADGANQPIYSYTIDAGKFYGFGDAYGEDTQEAFDKYGQYFPNPDQKGFIGILAGTEITTISEQWVLNLENGAFVKGTDFDTQLINYAQLAANFKLRFFQKFSFTNVPSGSYIFRILSHQVDLRTTSISDAEKTSTYTIGQYDFDFNRRPEVVDFNNQLNDYKELVIDVCNSDYDGLKDNKILQIWSMVAPNRTIDAGYVYNTIDPTQAKNGVELLTVEGGEFNSKNTDHNGFYFAAGKTTTFGGQFNFSIKGFCNCTYVELIKTRSGQSDQLFPVNYYLNDNKVCPNYENNTCNFILIKGKIRLCNSQIGVPGVGVVLARGASTITDIDGEFTIKAYDDTQNTIRNDKIYFVPTGCSFRTCDNNCLEPIEISIIKCTICEDRIINIGDTEVSYTTNKGLLSGMTYPVGVVGWDWLGRPTFVQPLGNITTPSVQQTKNFSPSRVKVTIDPSAIFPAEIQYLTFWIGDAADIADYITWIVDKVEFIDNTGLVNEDAPTQIKIRYASLVEYNKQNNFNTTTIWDFIPAGENTPVVSDKVQFQINGDGKFFPQLITALVKYDQTGTYFLINYTNDLKDLKANAVIRLLRPKQCTTEEPYFEVCTTIMLKNRSATINQFYLNTFDTYYIYRQIPVPTVLDEDNTINQIRILGIPFEHHSPSDFWGYKCHNIGRAHFKNPYETELYHEEQMALSGALSENGELNFLNFFDSAKKTDFKETGIGGIVANFPFTGGSLVIGQLDWFTVGFSDTVARVNDAGQVVAPSINDQFGQASGKVGNNYGCRLFDKNTLYNYKGLVQYLDTNAGFVIQHDYQQANPISNNGTDSYIKAKVKYIQTYNLTHANKKYFFGVVDCAANSYLLSDFTIKSTSYVNHLRDKDVSAQETIAYGIYSKACKGWFSATPQYYCELEGDIKDKQLFLFKDGKPYRQYNINNTNDFGKVFGEIVLSILKPVIVIDNFVKKKPLSIGVLCKQSQFFSDEIKTETGQQSRILLAHWLQAEFGWYAPFLCDLNTLADSNLLIQTGANKILDGNPLVGNWISVRLVCKPEDATKYFELQGFVMSVFKDGNNLINK